MPNVNELYIVCKIKQIGFSFDTLKEITNGFRNPAVIKGLFSGTIAIDRWKSSQYLIDKIGHYKIDVVKNATINSNDGTQSIRETLSLRDTINEIYGNNESKMYAFFPIKSRTNVQSSEVKLAAEDLQNQIDLLVHDDLELDSKIWKGFGTNKKTHSTFEGSQMIFGQGFNDTSKTTGTGWHCAIGNNYFVKVIGRKRWFFINPNFTKHLNPGRIGQVSFLVRRKNMHLISQHLPLEYTDLEAGDMLYNPDFYWHTIQNYKG